MTRRPNPSLPRVENRPSLEELKAAATLFRLFSMRWSRDKLVDVLLMLINSFTAAPYLEGLLKGGYAITPAAQVFLAKLVEGNFERLTGWQGQPMAKVLAAARQVLSPVDLVSAQERIAAIEGSNRRTAGSRTSPAAATDADATTTTVKATQASTNGGGHN